MKLSGKALLMYFDGASNLSYTERCTTAGYMKTLEDGTQGCDFTALFEAILDARRELKQRHSSDWYESLTVQDAELYDAIEDVCPEFTKFDAEQCQEFMDELSEHGITTAEQFNDAYYWQADSWRAEIEFAEFITTEVNCCDIPNYVVVDWQATWDCNLCYDFFTIEFDGVTYFFHNNF
jgi:hypothetical protein